MSVVQSSTQSKPPSDLSQLLVQASSSVRTYNLIGVDVFQPLKNLRLGVASSRVTLRTSHSILHGFIALMWRRDVGLRADRFLVSVCSAFALASPPASLESMKSVDKSHRASVSRQETV